MSKSEPLRRVVESLAEHFRRDGYIRWQNSRRASREGRDYHKGDELRLAARSQSELRRIRRLLREAGFKPGRPFVKGRQFRQPLYGRQSVVRFLRLLAVIQSAQPAEKAPPHRAAF
jgi:hypothetical protein